MKTLLKKEKGNALIEALVVVAVFSIISIPMFIFMFDMIKSANQTEEEIFLRDEADYVLGEFIQYIFASSDITESGQSADKGKKVVTETFDQKKYTVGFENGNAIVEEGKDPMIINGGQYEVTDRSSIEVDPDRHLVNITLVIKSKKTNQELELKSSIGYL